MKFISHRCMGFGEPENSSGAFARALHSGMDAVEIDVRVAGDGVFVVCHDPWFKDRRGRLRLVSRSSADEGFFTLRMAFELFNKSASRSHLAIDIKTPGFERELVELIREFGLSERAIVISWEFSILERIHSLAPDLRLSLSMFQYFRLRNCLPIGFSLNPPRSVRERAIPLESVNVVARWMPLRRGFVRRLAECGVKVNVVSSNSMEAAAELARWGVAGIFTQSTPPVARSMSLGAPLAGLRPFSRVLNPDRAAGPSHAGDRGPLPAA